MKLKHILFSALLFFIGLNVYARFADPSESTYTVKKLHVYTFVHRDGSFENTVDRWVEITKEAARTTQGLYRFTFNPASESVEEIKAETINSKKITTVKKSDIQIKPLASTGPGFDTQSQVSVAFPNVDVGSVLHIRYKIINRKPTIPGMFSDHASFGYLSLIEDYSETWDSEAPLYYEIHDPKGYFEVTKKETSLHLRLKKPLFEQVLEEKNSYYDAKSMVWFAISTVKDWAHFPKSTIMAYEKVMGEKLPKSFSELLSKAKVIDDPYLQMDTVTSELATGLRYLGDWRAVRGAYHPRSLQEISKSGYGDCKDMTVATGAILSHLGYEVHAAFISRGVDMIHSPLKLSAPNFNHAILWAKKNGIVYWIDPTNYTSSSKRIFSDIANRPAVVLDRSGAYLTRTPEIDAESEVIQMDLNLDLQSKDFITGSGEIALLGFASESMAGDALSESKANLDYRLITWATKMPNLISWKFDDYDLKSRIIKDFRTKFEFKSGWQHILTSQGKGLLIEGSSLLQYFNIPLNDRVSALKFTDPHHATRTVRFTNGNFRSQKNHQCSGQFKWFDFDRSMKMVDKALVVRDDYRIKTDQVELNDLRSPEFARAQKELLSCMNDFVLVTGG